jgi:glycerol-3-phosphate dehydrogenase
VLDGADGPEPPLVADLTPREARWMIEREWARTPDDILWRRTKLGLRVSEAEVAALARFMGAPVDMPGRRAAE